MPKVLTELPVGERVGLAFSGGLDTSVAVAWMREKGRFPAPTPATSASTTSPTSIPSRAARWSTAPRSPAWSTALPAMVEEGLVALVCGAFHIRTGGKTYFNTTPIGRAVTGTMLVRAMREDDVWIWGDGSTYKGNDIERFYRYGLLANPQLRIYKPWLDAAFVTELGGRAEMSQWLTERNLPYRDSKEKAYSTDANIWGATHEAKELEHLNVGIEIVEPIMGVRFWDPSVEIDTEDVTVTFEQGRPVPINGETFATAVDLVLEANAIGGRHGLGMSDQIENRIIEAKSRGIYEAPGMALLHIAYERLVNAIHNEDTLANYQQRGPQARPADVRGPLARPAVADAARVAAALGGLGRHRRVTVRLRRGDDYSILDTAGPHALILTRSDSQWSASADAAFGPLDRIGQLTMRNLDIADSRTRLEQYAQLGLVGGEVSALVGQLEAGTAPAIAAGEGTDSEIEAAQTRSGMEAGTD